MKEVERKNAQIANLNSENERLQQKIARIREAFEVTNS